MERRTRLLIGAALIATGLGVAALALVEDDQAVVYVETLLGEPARHGRGTFVLMGIPQPASLPVAGGEAPNPGYANTTVNVTPWMAEGVLYHSTHSLSAGPDAAGTLWTYRNETRRAGSPELAFPATARTWTTPGTAFPVEAFDDDDGDTPRVWALYDGVLKNPLQPKPAQFEGRLLRALPDGTPVPDGALLWAVDPGGITMGCSSKLIPEAAREKYAEGDGAAA